MDLSSRNLLNTNVHGRRNHVRRLLDRLTEDNFFKPSSDLFPLALRRLIQMIGIGIEPLVKETDDEEGLTATTRCSLGETLQKEYILSLRMYRGELQELSEFVQNQKQPLALRVGDNTPVG